jgi:hypothetical protein
MKKVVLYDDMARALSLPPSTRSALRMQLNQIGRKTSGACQSTFPFSRLDTRVTLVCRSSQSTAFDGAVRALACLRVRSWHEPTAGWW